MSKKQKDNPLRDILFAALAGTMGISVFARVFPDRNQTLNVLGIVILSIAAGMFIRICGAGSEKRAWPAALIGGAVFFGAAFGAALLTDRLLLKTISAAQAALIMAGVFGAAFVAGAVICAVRRLEKRNEKILACAGAAVLLCCGVLSAVQPALS